MAETDPVGMERTRVLRIPVRRPAAGIAAALALGAALLSGGGAGGGVPTAAVPTVPAPQSGPRSPASPLPADWDVTPRDLVVGQRTEAVLLLDQVVADAGGPAGRGSAPEASSLARALQPLLLGVARPALGSTDVPDVLWSAYRAAAASAPTACRLPVPLLAAIGQVESGSLAGRGLDSRHRVVPAVLGPRLDGNGFAAIRDTDGGRLDGDTTWDRAVGPMQFIPSTWQRWARDGNADGRTDPQNVEDSAFSAAAYLCAGGRDLSTAAGLRSAILSYNQSEVYLVDVLQLMRTVTPGGPLPRSAVRADSRPLMGPPSSTPTPAASRPPVRAVARPDASTTATTRPTSTSGTTAAGTPSTPSTSSTTTASPTSPGATTTTSTTTGTTTGTTAPTPTTTQSQTGSGSSTTTTSTTTTPTTTSSPTGSGTTSAPTPSTTTCPVPTGSTPTTGSSTTGTTTSSSPATTSASTSSSSPATTTTTTSGGTGSSPTTEPSDPCASTGQEPVSGGAQPVVWSNGSWTDSGSGQGMISNLTVLVLMLASVSLTLTRVPRSLLPVAFARTAGSST